MDVEAIGDAVRHYRRGEGVIDSKAVAAITVPRELAVLAVEFSPKVGITDRRQFPHRRAAQERRFVLVDLGQSRVEITDEHERRSKLCLGNV